MCPQNCIFEVAVHNMYMHSIYICAYIYMYRIQLSIWLFRVSGSNPLKHLCCHHMVLMQIHFQGGVNSKLQNGSCFCGCGSRVLSCSEDGTVSMWDANTGERIAIYKGLFLPESPATLSFHPKDNMLALVSHKVGAFPALVLSAFSR